MLLTLESKKTGRVYKVQALRHRLHERSRLELEEIARKERAVREMQERERQERERLQREREEREAQERERERQEREREEREKEEQRQREEQEREEQRQREEREREEREREEREREEREREREQREREEREREEREREEREREREQREREERERQEKERQERERRERERLKRIAKKFKRVAGTTGLEWEEVGSEKPNMGTEIKNKTLAEALLNTRHFSPEEWEKLGVTDVTSDCFIKVGDKYFAPCKPSWHLETKGFSYEGQVNEDGEPHGQVSHHGNRQFCKYS